MPMKTLLTLSIALLYFNFSNAQEKEMNAFIDSWHKAAAEADIDEYFGKMDDSFVFLGTAPGERWSKLEFYAFASPYFEKKKTWDFKPSNRNFYTYKNAKLIWFDEDLDTWMEGCRGSGILIKDKRRGYKLLYYNLTVLIENEKIESFIELRKQ